MKCRVVETLPSPDEYNQLRASVGWGVYERGVADAALPGSLYCVCALVAGSVVGMARAIGDGGLVFYIQDVIVRPEYQRQGIGTMLMERIMAYIRSHAHLSPTLPATTIVGRQSWRNNSVIGLMAAAGKEPFYERYGFATRPNDRLGSGMTIFWRV